MQLEKDLQGVLVQEIPGARAVQQVEGEGSIEVANGVLRVLLVALEIEDPFRDSQGTSEKSKHPSNETSSDIWVVLEIGSNFSMPVRATQTIVPQRTSSSYLFPSADVPGAAIQLILPSNQNGSIDQFENLLADYCAFQMDAKGKGALEIVDERGDVMGTIDGPWQLEEDKTMYQPGREKDPVLLELPDESRIPQPDQKVNVSAAPRDEYGGIPEMYQNDWLMRGASLVTKTLVGGSAWAGQKMVEAADRHVAKTPPRTATPSGSEKMNEKDGSQQGSATLTTSGRPAVTFSPRVHQTSQQLKAFSGTATKVSGRTRDAVLSVAAKVGDTIGKGTGIQRQTKADGTVVQPKGVRGFLNRSVVAANIVLDGFVQSTDNLIRDGSRAGGKVIEHHYGSEAKVISGNTASLGRSVYVVYKDINGVRRKAMLKMATGTIRARAPDGSEVVLQQQVSQPPSRHGQTPPPPSYEVNSKSEKR